MGYSLGLTPIGPFSRVSRGFIQRQQIDHLLSPTYRPTYNHVYFFPFFFPQGHSTMPPMATHAPEHHHDNVVVVGDNDMTSHHDHMMHDMGGNMSEHMMKVRGDMRF